MSKRRTLSDWLNYLESRQFVPIRLGLTHVHQVASCLNLLKSDAWIITVGGTNGKGSTITMLEAFYKAAGYRVGLYTSPHLLRFNERIKINQQEVDDAALCSAFEAIDAVPESQDLTYFEMTTLAALWLFKAAHLDIMLLEVGMGGRLDATNIMDAHVALVTTVDLDHQAWLGETREAIGFEKAGIFRPNRLAIYGDRMPPDTLKKVVDDQQSLFYCLGRDYDVIDEGDTACLMYHNKVYRFKKNNLHLHAVAQALMVLFLTASSYPVSESAIHHALTHVTLLGRLQCHEAAWTTIYDVAHNAQAVALLAKTIALRLPIQGRVYAIFGALKDKDIAALIHPMKAWVDTWFVCALPGSRGLTCSEMKIILENVQLDAYQCYNTPVEAYKKARQVLKPGDLLVVYGSFLTVGAVLSWPLNCATGEYDDEKNCVR